MRFSAVLSLLVASVAAQTTGFDSITAPTSGQTVTTGSTLMIVWEDTVSEPITITLLQGASQASLQLGDVIATSIDSSLGTYEWKVPSSVAGYATYGFKLTLDSSPSTFQYSFPFKIVAGSTSSSSDVALAGTGSVSLENAEETSPTTGTAATTTVLVATTTPSSTAGNSSSGSSITSAPASQVTGSSSNSTGNFTFTTSTTKASAPGASTVTSKVVVAATGTSSGASATSTSSSDAMSAAAVQCLSLMGVVGISVAMVI